MKSGRIETFEKKLERFEFEEKPSFMNLITLVKHIQENGQYEEYMLYTLWLLFELKIHRNPKYHEKMVKFKDLITRIINNIEIEKNKSEIRKDFNLYISKNEIYFSAFNNEII